MICNKYVFKMKSIRLFLGRLFRGYALCNDLLKHFVDRTKKGWSTGLQFPIFRSAIGTWRETSLHTLLSRLPPHHCFPQKRKPILKKDNDSVLLTTCLPLLEYIMSIVFSQKAFVNPLKAHVRRMVIDYTCLYVRSFTFFSVIQSFVHSSIILL